MTETGTTAPNTLMMTATYNMFGDQSRFEHVWFAARFATKSEAEEFAAKFPKSAKLRTENVRSSYTESTMGDYWSVNSSIGIMANGRNGAINETGMKRVRTILKFAAKSGVEVQWHTQYGNSYSSLEAFMKVVEAVEATV